MNEIKNIDDNLSINKHGLNTLNNNALHDAFDKYMRSYFTERNAAKTFALFDDNMTVIGTGLDEVVLNPERVKEFYLRDLEQASNTVEFTYKELIVEEISPMVGLVKAVISLSTLIGNSILEIEELRISAIFKRTHNKYFLLHKHISCPTKEYEDGESYPIQELQKQNARLESIITDKTKELVKINEALQNDIIIRKDAENQVIKKNIELAKANAEKDKFFSIIAHDLKSPLGNFKQVASLLSDSYNSFTESDKLEYLKLLKNSSHNIYALLENLLEWSKSQRGLSEFYPTNFEFNTFITNHLEIHKASIFNKNISIDLNIEPNLHIYADINMLSAILRNLISNAIKFTNSGGLIAISANTVKNNVIIEIKDNGLGISEVLKEKLFIIGESTTTEGTNGESGTGLGLILCKEFVEKHNGNIWVESELGKGSAFKFSLPK